MQHDHGKCVLLAVFQQIFLDPLRLFIFIHAERQIGKRHHGRVAIGDVLADLMIFSLGRVFRREAIDYSHLAEFYQAEGIVMEPGASFAMLVGVMREFYQRLGFEDIRVRPGYFPYTEPSMEVEVLLGDKWLEMGGSGVFRPEVTAPFGVKDPVLAWGQGLERIAMILYGIDDIRQLYETDLDWLRKRPLE